MRVAVCISLTLASIPVAGSGWVADPPQPPAAKKDRSQQIVCKEDTYVGSHIPQRVCKTREEWDEAAKASQQLLDRERDLQKDPSILPGNHGG